MSPRRGALLALRAAVAMGLLVLVFRLALRDAEPGAAWYAPLLAAWVRPAEGWVALAAAAFGASFAVGALRFEPARRRLHRGPEEIRLTEAESALLATLAEHAGRPVSREALGGSGDEGGRAVDVQIARLRRKIESDPRFPRYLQTVRGQGYMLQPD